MAGDWIKMRKSLLADPRVVRISSALKADRLRTLGGLLSAWCLIDEQTEDGNLEGYTPEIFDDLVGCPGLARAMASVGWLTIENESLMAPRFEEHNGQTAKRRAQDSVRKMSARGADKCPPEKRTKSGPEKRREEFNTHSLREPEIPPVTLKVALSNCGQFGATPEIAERWWHARESVGWMIKGQIVVKWQSDLTGYAKQWRNNEGKTKHGNDSRPNRPTVTRNVGALDPNRPSLNATAVNAGQAGKPAGLEADGGPGLDFDGQGGW